MSYFGMIPALLVVLAMAGFTDTGMGALVRAALRGLWRLARRQQDSQQAGAQASGPDGQASGPDGQASGPDGQASGPDGQAMVPVTAGQVAPPVPQPVSRWRSLLPFRRPPIPTAGVGHVNPQVSGPYPQQGPWQGGIPGPWQGGPAGAPTGPVAWPTGPAWGAGPVPAWGTAQVPPPGWHPTGQAWTGAVPAQPVPQPVPQAVATQPMPAPPAYPVTAPATQPVTQPAAGVYACGQGHSVRLDPPQPVTAQGPATGMPPGGDPGIATRRAVVAGALPQLQVTPHGEQGRLIAALAASLGVDARTIYRDIEALTMTSAGQQAAW